MKFTAVSDILDEYQNIVFDFWVNDLMVKKGFNSMSTKFKTSDRV